MFQNYFTIEKDSNMSKRIVNTIKKFRFEKEMTQQDLADLAGVTRQTIIAIENEKYFPTLELAFKISEIFDKPLDSIFKYE